MENSEKFSPAGEFKKLERERISSGMFAIYPESWGPIEEEKKEEILTSTTKEINRALQKKDFARAGGLIRSLRNYFSKDVIEKRMASMEYVVKSPIEPESVAEISRLFKVSDWDATKENLQKYSDMPLHYLGLVVEMRKFDPQRFDKEIEIPDDMWQRLVDEVKRSRNDSERLLYIVSRLKELDPEKFKRDVKINDSDWGRIAKRIETNRGAACVFVDLYQMAHSLDAQKIQKLIPIDEDYWNKIRQQIERTDYNPHLQAMVAEGAQQIKPEGLSEITVSKYQFEGMKYELWAMLKFYTPEQKAFAFANALKRLKVE